MTQYDFFIKDYKLNDTTDRVHEKLIVEKLPFITDIYGVKRQLDGKYYPSLEVWLKKYDVDDQAISAIVEQLEALPYGQKHAYAVGRDGRILIEQEV